MVKRKILVGGSDTLMVQMGLISIDELREDAAQPNAPQSLRDDWTTVSQWLDWTKGDFTEGQSSKIKSAFAYYYAIGLAPSIGLQKQFDIFAEQLKGAPKGERPPTEIMNVFDRLVATDEQIAEKRKLDLQNEMQRLRPLVAKLGAKESASWWRGLESRTRLWIFGCSVWAAVMLVYAYFFDPFKSDGWDYMDDADLQKLIIIIAAPAVAGLVFRAYEKWVR